MRVPIKLRHSISMLIEVTILSPTSTCQLITHQHLGTMRISHMEEEHNKVKDLGRIFNKLCFTWVQTTTTTVATRKSESGKSGTKEISFL